MYKYFSTSFFIILSFCVCLSQEADHIIFTQITITPDETEVIAIYNPTDETINLSNYYLSDAEYSSTNSHYYNLPTGNDYWSGFSSDFIVRLFLEDPAVIPICIDYLSLVSFSVYFSVSAFVFHTFDLASVC